MQSGESLQIKRYRNDYHHYGQGCHDFTSVLVSPKSLAHVSSGNVNPHVFLVLLRRSTQSHRVRNLIFATIETVPQLLTRSGIGSGLLVSILVNTVIHGDQQKSSEYNRKNCLESSHDASV
jgi:hypothetical protein